MSTPTIPSHLKPLLQVFLRHGERAYPVGGCVRDSLRGVPPHDWDVAVTTPPEQTRALCAAAGYRTIPTGLQHGTITVLVPHSGDPRDRDGRYDPVECTTCRTEGGYADGRHPDAVAFTGRIEDDLARRDFTINAMAFLPGENAGDNTDELTVLDLFGGRDDLQNGIIRCVGEPDVRFSEDALRMLRAVRFAVRLGFTIEPTTNAAIRRGAHGLARISRERIGDEFGQILCGEDPLRGIALLQETGLIPHVLPAGLSPLGIGDLTSLPPAIAPRLACLQCGLPAEHIDRNLAGLRLPNALRRDVLTLATAGMTPPDVTPCGARAWRHNLGPLAIQALLVQHAHAAETDRPAIDAMIALVEASEAAQEPVNLADLAINGRDLIAGGHTPGPALQSTLRHLLEAVWADPTKNTQEALIKLATRWKD